MPSRRPLRRAAREDRQFFERRYSVRRAYLDSLIALNANVHFCPLTGTIYVIPSDYDQTDFPD